MENSSIHNISILVTIALNNAIHTDEIMAEMELLEMLIKYRQNKRYHLQIFMMYQPMNNQIIVSILVIIIQLNY